MERRKPMHQIIDGVPRCERIDPEKLRQRLQFRARAGDLVQSTFPKSGTHWMMYIVQLILRDAEPMTSYEEFHRGWRFFEYNDTEEWDLSLPLRSFITHLPLSEETITEQGKYIYVARNPWDVCLSFYHMVTNLSMYQYEDATFEEFVEVFVGGNFGYGDYFEHVASAYDLREEPNVLFVTYEEMTKNRREVVLRVAHFLGDRYGRALADDESLLDKILNRSNAEYMRGTVVIDLNRMRGNACEELSERRRITCKKGFGGDETKYNLVRTAKVGGWQEYFTPYLLKRMEDRIREAEKTTSFMDPWKDIRTEAINSIGNFRAAFTSSPCE